MPYNFGSQKNDLYGTYGEFTVSSGDNCVRAQYVLSKMKPGSGGTWENLLASQMVPWREIFNVEELTFDELLQRDLDDSRVAHDLIPYLLGNQEAEVRFFPPILAVLVPRNFRGTGIQEYYPRPNIDDNKLSFGELFDFEKVKFNGDITPLGVIQYNQQKTSFVIVDGQHRAMAVLALHRQITSSWQADRYASFYNHLLVEPNQVNNIELPVCIIFFPDLHEDNGSLREKGIDLKTTCREIFLVVNKTAKKVSQSRELLLDDQDLAAKMMRTTLSELKGRGEDSASVARIYSFAFGDDDSGRQVLAGQLEYSSAVALHKMHSAVVFGPSEAFRLDRTTDITDGRRTRNPDRPAHILIGTDLERWSTLSRLSGKHHPRHDVDKAVKLLAEISNIVLLDLFDRFHPFAVHNASLRELRTRLSYPEARADLIQRQCYSLLFEGSGAKYVFEQHYETLKKKKNEAEYEGRSPSDYIVNQLRDAGAILRALTEHEKGITQKRACKLFKIDYRLFSSAEGNENHRKELLSRSRSIFDSISTQAFQLGYLMLVHSIVQELVDSGTQYSERCDFVKFISNLYLIALNRYFDPGISEHRTLTGLVNESRSKVFDQSQLGLRGLLALSVRELNERQWIFFRYAILEMVHCKYSYSVLLQYLESTNEVLARAYRSYLPDLINHMIRIREQYVQSAIDVSLNSSDFKTECQMRKATLIGANEDEVEIDAALNEMESKKRTEISEKCKSHIRASLGEVATSEMILNRLLSSATSTEEVQQR